MLKNIHPFLFVLILAALSACSKPPQRDEITVTRNLPKRAHSSGEGVTSAMRFGYSQASGDHDQCNDNHDQKENPSESGHSESAKMRWQTPDEWQEKSASGMRLGSFRAGPQQEADCAVFVLAGRAGGITANINRWRGEMRQARLSEDEIASLERIQVMGKDAVLLEIKGDFRGSQGYMMLALIAGFGEKTLFIKMTGPEDTVNGERKRFITFCQSIR